MNLSVIVFILGVLLSLLSLVGCYMLGTKANRKIDKEIADQQEKLQHIALLNSRHLDETILRSLGVDLANCSTQLVSTGIVLGVDSTRSMFGRLKQMLGGRIGYFTDLQTRGREIASIRLQQEAEKINAVAVFNVKFAASSLNYQHDPTSSNKAANLEFSAYGTAIIPKS